MNRHWAVLLSAAAVVALASCGPSPATRPAPYSGHHKATLSALPRSPAPAVVLSDVATQAKCPPGAPPQAECFRITVTGTTADWGRVSSGGWFDVEAGPGSPACGKPVHYSERIVTAKGTVTVRAAGPRLCAGAVGTVHRTYTVVKATGALRRLSGHGIITLTVLSTGATEAWTRPKS